MTSWLDCLCNIWPFAKLKIWPVAVFARNIGTKLCQTLNKPSKFCPRLWIFCQSGKSLPNLVTLKAPEVRVCYLIEIDREDMCALVREWDICFIEKDRVFMFL